MATVVADDGTVNPPPTLEGQTFVTKKIKDARGNLVTDKGANGAFLAYREYKVKKEEEDRLKAEKVKRREEKIAKGIALGPEDELEKEQSAAVALLRVLLVFIGIVLALGWFITGSALWNYDGKWVQLRTYFPDPTHNKLLHEYELARFDGSIPGSPVYIAIDGDVYDVTAGAHSYGPSGKYHNFAGVDAARAFATACTNGHRTHDLRGLTEKQLKSLAKWKKYFEDKPTYPRVGRVIHQPIKWNDPLPLGCGEEPPKQEPKFGPGVKTSEQKPAKREDL